MINYNDINQAFPDPYDVWMGERAVRVREQFYAGSLMGKLSAAIIAGADWLAPGIVRRLFKAAPRKYPITTAQLIMMNCDVDSQSGIRALKDCAVSDFDQYGLAWGLGFNWMSKNGLYSPNMPFVTHTPYAMEALLVLAAKDPSDSSAINCFQQTWPFLESLQVMAESEDTLALSYAPLFEPRIVVNANAYAALAHMLHAQHNETVADTALEKARRITRFVVRSQNDNGAWHYYADNLPGNFIDCFHSCFVLKNLIKAAALDPTIALESDSAVERGFEFVQTQFVDLDRGLVRRFVERDITDPYRWDIYDQAEYLGILIDLGNFSEAEKLVDQVTKDFFDGTHWYCRIDIVGRKWGKDFGRWGIVPFLHQRARLQQQLDREQG